MSTPNENPTSVQDPRLSVIRGSALFQGMTDEEINDSLSVLGAREKEYHKGDTVLRAGDTTRELGLILSGSVMIESNDLWGNRTILDIAGPGDLFAEVYAILENEPLLIDVRANEDCRVLFIRVGSLKQESSNALKQESSSALRQESSSGIVSQHSGALMPRPDDRLQAPGTKDRSQPLRQEDRTFPHPQKADPYPHRREPAPIAPPQENRPGWQAKLNRNLLLISARKNLTLSGRAFHTSPKTIRGRIMAYLDTLSLRMHSREFEIPFDRQQLSDYLNVERTALSKELWKMQKEGLIEFKKNHFKLPASTW